MPSPSAAAAANAAAAAAAAAGAAAVATPGSIAQQHRRAGGNNGPVLHANLSTSGGQLASGVAPPSPERNRSRDHAAYLDLESGMSDTSRFPSRQAAAAAAATGATTPFETPLAATNRRRSNSRGEYSFGAAYSAGADSSRGRWEERDAEVGTWRPRSRTFSGMHVRKENTSVLTVCADCVLFTGKMCADRVC